MTIAQLIRLNRQKLGISQLELAEKLGVSQAAIGQWEREVTAPRSKNFPELAKIFGIDVEQIIAAADELAKDYEGRAASEGRRTEHERSSVNQFIKGQMEFFKSLPENERASLWGHAEESKRFEDNLFKLLPIMGSPGARNALFRSGSEEDSAAWIADYVSEKSIVEIKHPAELGHVGQKVLQSLWTLTILRAITSEDQNFIALVRLPSPRPGDDEHAKLIGKMKALVDRHARDASVVGLKLIAVETAEEAAKAIVEIEQESSFEDGLDEARDEYITRLLDDIPEK